MAGLGDLKLDRKMRNKVGAAFATGMGISAGKEFTTQSIFAAMFINHMIAVSGGGGGGGGFGASATTGPGSPAVDEKELTSARHLGKRVAGTCRSWETRDASESLAGQKAETEMTLATWLDAARQPRPRLE